MMRQGFESIASYYDGLVRITSGNLLYNNAISLFSKIEKISTVLVIGDGSGKITAQLLSQYSITTLHYVELSPTLITKAKERLSLLIDKNKLSTKVHFLNQDIFACKFPIHSIDMVLTPYFLDIWSNEQLQKLIRLITPSLKEEGVWYVSDFNPEVYKKRGMLNFIYRGLIRMLYQFFNWTVGLETKSLPDIVLSFKEMGYHLYAQKVIAKDLLVSMVWKKTSTSRF